jgi:hypothetical protein
VRRIECTGGQSRDGTQQGGETEAEEAEDAGESTRLKLQTPIFVADALMQAAERQLDLEMTYCEEEVCTFLFAFSPFRSFFLFV